jgi:hypothetical protein
MWRNAFNYETRLIILFHSKKNVQCGETFNYEMRLIILFHSKKNVQCGETGLIIPFRLRVLDIFF